MNAVCRVMGDSDIGSYWRNDIRRALEKRLKRESIMLALMLSRSKMVRRLRCQVVKQYNGTLQTQN